MFSTNTVTAHETAKILQRCMDKARFLLVDNILYLDKNFRINIHKKISQVFLCDTRFCLIDFYISKTKCNY